MPTGEWTVLDEALGLWTAQYRIPGNKSRSTSVRLRDGSFAVISPGGGLEDAFAEIGDVTFLVAPNSYHHLGFAAWRRRFPNAQIAAGFVAHTRLKKNGITDVESLADLKLALPSNTWMLEPPGTRIGEAWLDVPCAGNKTWVIGDSFFNVKEPRRMKDKLVQRATKAGPGLAMSRPMKYGGLSNRPRFLSWLDGQLLARKPTRIVPLHGDIMEADDLYETVRQFAAARLGTDD
jgi:hypothetical protein